MSERRLIGIDLAWSENNGSGCVELAQSGSELELKRLEILYSMEDIMNWIDPARGHWVVAVDAPLIVCNKKGSRDADKKATCCYGKFHAGAYPANRNRLGGYNHGVPRGEELLCKLKPHGATLVEQMGDIAPGSLVFETYPHVAMVELFNLCCTIKYKASQCKKKGGVCCQRRGQQELADKISEHLCGGVGDLCLQPSGKLDDLLCEPDPILKGNALKGHEDKLDAVVCAYTAAWLDAGGDLVGLGKVGEGVMIAPRLREIGPPLS